MGGSSWSDDSYRDRVSSKVATHGTAFAYTKDVSDGKVAKKVHSSLDPKGLKVRESRDSAAHPESNAIVVGLDETGSMGAVVHTIHKKLPTLMGILTRKSYIPDPQIMFCGVGDASSGFDGYGGQETAPLQVGQFESGDEMEGDLANLYIEGLGGGQNTESYELLAYVGARKTSIDCLEKRGKKGYFFIIGDELAYPKVKKDQITRLIGPELEDDIPTPVIFKELQEKYVVFFILPAGATNGGSKLIRDRWADLIGAEHVLELQDPNAVAELIATQIGLCEGSTDLDAAAKDLEDHGTSKALVNVVRSAVSTTVGGNSLAKVPAGSLTTNNAPSSVKRL